MSAISQQRCRNHAQREAVARCPECLRYFCRECIVEHDSRVVCASCLSNLAGEKKEKKWRISGVMQAGQFLLGLFVIWTCFYLLGRTLLTVPSGFHAITYWQSEVSRMEE